MSLVAVIEDDEMLAEIYETTLTAADFQVVVAHDGKTALDLIQKAKPDLVLLDIMMPIMSGDEALEVMRNSDWGKDIPVIMLTNISEVEAPERLKKYHFERFLIKANNSPQGVVEIVKEVLAGGKVEKPLQQ